MSTQQIIVPVGNEVAGDITNCKIENVILSINRSSAFSLRQTVSYASYDVCTKEIIQIYDVPEQTEFCAVVIALCFLLIVPLAVNYLPNRISNLRIKNRKCH